MAPENAVNTYRVNGATGLFETWDGEAWHSWNGKIQMDDLFYHYVNDNPGNKLGRREVWFTRKTGEMSDQVRLVSTGSDLSTYFKGVCQPVEKPKPAPNLF